MSIDHHVCARVGGLEHRLVAHTALVTFEHGQLASHPQLIHLVLPVTLAVPVAVAGVAAVPRLAVGGAVAVLHAALRLLQSARAVGADQLQCVRGQQLICGRGAHAAVARHRFHVLGGRRGPLRDVGELGRRHLVVL